MKWLFILYQMELPNNIKFKAFDGQNQKKKKQFQKDFNFFATFFFSFFEWI